MVPNVAEGLASCAELWVVTRYGLPGPLRLQAVSPMLCGLVGYSQDALCNMEISDFVHPEDMERSLEARQNIVHADKHSGVFRTVTRWKRSVGGYVTLEWASNTPGNEYTFHVARDVTRLRFDMAQQALDLACLKEMATTDNLTGLYNRRMMMETLEKEISRAIRGNRLSLATFDVDHFKKVNDTFGHDAGDEALRQVADCLRYAVRKEDSCFRPGGEEFTIILPDCSALAAFKVVARIVETVAKKTTVTVSAGVATFPSDGTTSAELLRRADLAMYEAKRLGRNQAVAAGSEQPAA